MYPLTTVYPSKAQYFTVHCSTLYPEVQCTLQYPTILHSTPAVPSSTKQYSPVPCRYGDYKLAKLPSLPPLSDQLIGIKQAFSSIKIVQNYKEIMLKCASDSTWLFLLNMKILFFLSRIFPIFYKGFTSVLLCREIFIFLKIPGKDFTCSLKHVLYVI